MTGALIYSHKTHLCMHAINIGYFVCVCLSLSLSLSVSDMLEQSQHNTHILQFAATCSSSFYTLLHLFLLLFFSCSWSMCTFFAVWNCMELFSSTHNEHVRKKDQLRHFHVTIVYICMRTHDSDKLLWWYSKWRVTRWKSETQNNRQWLSGKREQQQQQQ